MRQEYQEQGRKLAREHHHDKNFVAGCMLYWGEGSKSRGSLELVNSDIHLLRQFMRILPFFKITSEEVTIRVYCYADIKTKEEIETFWLTNLNLPTTALRKTILLKPSKSFQKKKGKSVYGTCHLSIYNVRVLQQLYGAIQELALFVNETWIQ